MTKTPKTEGRTIAVNESLGPPKRKDRFRMAKAIVARRPLAGDKTLAPIHTAIEDSIEAVDDVISRYNRELKTISDKISSLPKEKPIPSALLARTVEIIHIFLEFLGNRPPQPIEHLWDLVLFAQGNLVFDERGEFMSHDDYAIQQIEKRIAAIDWTHEPADDQEQELRQSVMAEIGDESHSRLDECQRLKSLSDYGEPASDLSAAIARAGAEWEAICEQSYAEARERSIRTMAFQIHDKMRTSKGA